MTRLGDALSELSGDRTSALDMIVPPTEAPDATEPADALAALLAPETAPELSPDDRAALVRLDTWKRAKARHKKAYEALGKDIEREETRLIELAVELGLIDERGRIAFGSLDDGQGFNLNPFERRTIWPKFREDPDTDQPYRRDQLIEVLRDLGLKHLIVETTEQYAWPGYVRERVKAWRKRAGQNGVTDDQGRFLDYDGEVLSAEEARDPVADILALPAKLRAVIEPVDKIELQFTRRQQASPAVAASDAAQAAATTDVA